MRKKSKKLALNSTLLLLSITLALCAGEVLIRFFPLQPPERVAHRKLFTEHDSLLGWRLIPNITEQYVQDEYAITESFNSKGIRGPEYSYEKQDDEYRILTLGDSFAEGYTVEFNELFSEVLEENLGHREGRNYEVINAGVSGYSTDQEVLFFQSEGKRYNPDLTVLMFFANDILYNERTRYHSVNKPRFILEEGELRLTNVPVPLPDTLAVQSAMVTTEHGKERPMPFINSLKAKSHLYQFVRRRIKNSDKLYRLAIKLGLVAEPKEPTQGTIQTVPEEFWVWEKEYHVKVRDAWEVTEALIVKLNEEAAIAGSELLIFYVPNDVCIYAELWQAAQAQYGLAEEAWNIEQVAVELESICERNDIDCFNPIPQFRAEAEALERDGKRFYFPKDGHWNVNGHQLAGELLAAYINATYLSKVN